jgi:hypothetical protein
MPVPCAQLKLFAPLASFPPDDRERWSAYVAAGGGLTRRTAALQEQRVAADWATVGRARRRAVVAGAYVRRVADRLLLAPLDLELRAARAFAAFAASVPPAVAAEVVPDPSVRQRLARIAGTGRLAHVLDAPWAAPLTWFLAFGPEERRVSDPPEGAGPRLVHLTTAAQGVARLTQVVQAVEGAIDPDSEPYVSLADLGEWLAGFDPTSVLELDLATVTRALPPASLRADRTCQELWDAVAALQAGDLLGAAARYGAVQARWRRLSDRGVAS